MHYSTALIIVSLCCVKVMHIVNLYHNCSNFKHLCLKYGRNIEVPKYYLNYLDYMSLKLVYVVVYPKCIYI